MALDGIQGLAREIPQDFEKFNDWDFVQSFDLCQIMISDQDLDLIADLNQALDTFH
jgi:hypothetical protein